MRNEYAAGGLGLRTRHFGRRVLRRAKYLLGHDPIFLPILLRLTPSGTSRQITRHTNLVVEGFPRSGNTFAVFALRNASNYELCIASHVHHPSQIKLGLARSLPTVLVVREPVAVLCSYLVFGPHGRPDGVIKEYISYHRELVPYVDQLVVCHFDEITSDMSSVIARINRRCCLNINPFDQSTANVARVFGEIALQHRLVHPRRDAVEVVPHPSAGRRELSAQIRQELLHPRNKALLADAFELYEFFASKAADQRSAMRDGRVSSDEEPAVGQLHRPRRPVVGKPD